MSTWLVRLTGHDFDLRSLAEQVRSPECTVRKEKNDEYYLQSSSLDPSMDVESVRERGRELIQRLNGIARLLNLSARPVSFGGDVMLLRDDGTRDVWAFPPPLTVRSAAVISVDGETEPRQPTTAEGWLAGADRDPKVARAVRLFGQEHTWDNLHKVLEAVEDAHGGEEALRGKEWVSRRRLRRFTSTANSARAVGDAARHGHERFAAPPNPMPLEEATELLQMLLGELLRSACSPSATPGSS